MDANKVFPTKGNLMASKKSLELSKQGYELMDRKRNILVREMMGLMDEAEDIQSRIVETFSSAYFALQNANLTLGIKDVNDIALAVEPEDGVEIKIRTLMGAEIPVLKKLDYSLNPSYGLARTNVSLDEAYVHFHDVKMLIIELAEVENAIYRLVRNIVKTRKRANALNNILIPKYEYMVKKITNELEEKEREEFSRLKMIKEHF